MSIKNRMNIADLVKALAAEGYHLTIPELHRVYDHLVYMWGTTDPVTADPEVTKHEPTERV